MLSVPVCSNNRCTLVLPEVGIVVGEDRFHLLWFKVVITEPF